MTTRQTKTQSGMTAAEVVDDLPDLPAPRNVIQAIARVMAEIGGIRKMTAAERQRLGIGGGDTGISYAYRGIDQLAQKAQPLLGMYGVVIVPNVTETTITKIVKGNATLENTQWTRTVVEVEWTLYGPGGVSDWITSITVGIGDDNSDKGHNKAMTTAFKNLLLRILCVGDPQDDTDGHGGNEEPVGTYQDPRPEVPLGAEVFAEIAALTDDRLKALLRQKAVDASKSLAEKALVADPEWAQTVRDSIAGYMEAKAQDAAAEEPPPDEPPANTNVTPIGGAAKRGSKKADEVTEQVAAQLSEQLGATDVSEETKTDG